jgi:hypothetical protein
MDLLLKMKPATMEERWAGSQDNMLVASKMN